MSHSHNLDVAGTVRLVEESASESQHIVLVPQPSNDPDDPLNWSMRRKYISLTCITLYTLANALSVSALFAIFVPIGEATGLTIDQLNQGTGYAYLPIGIGPLFLNPLALAYGKRPVYIVTALISTGLIFWTPYASSYGQWISNRLLVGFAGSPSFALTEVSISDVFFTHERGLPLGIYVLFLYIGATLAPLFGGYIFQGMGWKAVLYFAGGFMALVTVFLAIFMEETNFERQKLLAEALSTEEMQHQDLSTYNGGETKKDLDTPGVGEMVVTEPVRAVSREFNKQPAPWRPWATFGRVSPQASGILARGTLQPLALLGSPLIWWIGLMYGIYQIWFNTMGSLVAFSLSAPPYNFSPSTTGLVYVGPALSCIPGAVFGGWLSDRHSVKKAKKAGGIFEPEYRLSLFWLPSLIIPCGLLMMGLGPYYEAHWIVFVLGMTLVNMAGPLATVLVISYAFDCYHPIEPRDTLGPQAVTVQAAPYILTSMFIAMAMAFGYGYAVTPWIIGLGFKNYGITAAALATAFNLSAWPVIRYGKSLRRAGQGYYQKVVNQ